MAHSGMGGHKELEEGPEVKLDYTKLDKVASKHCDVVPVVVQDTKSGNVLICACVFISQLRNISCRLTCVILLAHLQM